MSRRKYGEPFQAEVEMSMMVTAFLDLSFQLLFFVVIGFNPSAMEGQFTLNIIATEYRGGGEQQAPPPNAQATPRLTNVELPPPLTVTALTTDKGRLESLEITGRLVGEGEGGLIREQSGLEGKAADEAIDRMLKQFEKKLYVLKEKQKAEAERAKNPDTGKVEIDERLQFQAKPNLSWKDSIRALGACRKTALVNDPKTGKARVVELNDPKDLREKAKDYSLFPKVEMARVPPNT